LTCFVDFNLAAIYSSLTIVTAFTGHKRAQSPHPLQ
jgi:hypothetical protein